VEAYGEHRLLQIFISFHLFSSCLPGAYFSSALTDGVPREAGSMRLTRPYCLRAGAELHTTAASLLQYTAEDPFLAADET